MTRPLLALAVALVAWPAAARAAGPDADVVRLAEGLSPEFERPKIVILPLLDQRPLAAAQPDAALAPPKAWAAFVAELQGRANLAVVAPEDAVRRLKKDQTYRSGLERARALAYQGLGAHREVRLDEAARELDQAVLTFREIGHQLVDPREVARAQLTRGLALLENDQDGPAYEAFQHALLLDPGLRLRPGFDRQETIDAFERARRALVAAGAPPPAEFATPPRRVPGIAIDAIVIRGRVVPGNNGEPDRLEVSYRVGGGVQEDAQPLGADPAEDGGRLASRVWACLPFGTAPSTPRPRRHLYLDAGFAYFAFLEAPVEVFSNFGAGAHLSWLFAPNFTFDVGVALTNSNRDREEDLRADVATVRGNFGAGYMGSWGRLRAFLTLGFEVASPGEVVTTTIADCKLFPKDVRPTLCGSGAFDRTGRALDIGGAASLGAALRLVDDLYLSARVDGAEYFFQTRDDGLGRPVGVNLDLGWKFF